MDSLCTADNTREVEAQIGVMLTQTALGRSQGSCPTGFPESEALASSLFQSELQELSSLELLND